MALFSPRRRWLAGPQRGRYRRDVVALADRHRWSALWRAAAEGSGITRTVHDAAGQTVIVPELVAVADNPDGPLALVVHLLPGQLPADVAAVADRLAPALGALRVRVVPLSDGRHVRLELLDVDPLAELRRGPRERLRSHERPRRLPGGGTSHRGQH